MYEAKRIMTRRAFLNKGLTLVGIGATIPLFVDRTAWAIGDPLDAPMVRSKPGVPDDRILVIVQLAGGNDGLNTIIPFRDDDYYRNRPRLAVPADKILKIEDDLGLHPSASDLLELYHEGMMALVQGVGYPNPNRSHFVSMDIWESASPERKLRTGWVGRYFDHACSGSDPCSSDSAIAITQETPLALLGDRFQGTAVSDPASLRWKGEGDRHMAEAFDRLNSLGSEPSEEASDDPVAFLTRVAMDARISADHIQKGVRREGGDAYPLSPLGIALRTVGKLIAAEFPTKVYYVSLPGFDTHTGQAGRHGNLLEQFAAGMKAFMLDLKQQGRLDQVLTMTFSEFGRRVAENASAGTDHGKAAPMFLFGGRIKPGIHGKHPSLNKLHDGDLAFNVDFRRVYADLIENWMGGDAARILGKKFTPLGIVRS